MGALERQNAREVKAPAGAAFLACETGAVGLAPRVSPCSHRPQGGAFIFCG